MSSNKKMEEADLKKIQDIQEEYDKLTFELGRVALEENQVQEQMNEVKKKRSKVESEIDQLEKKYQKVTKKLHQKYGTGLFDSKTGELIDAPKEQS